jgi:Flp pilus assembly protein TadG
MIPLLTLMLGAIQYGWWFYTAQSASSAARESARRLSVGDCQTGTEALDYAKKQANVIGLSLTFGTAVVGSDTAITGAGTLPAQGSQLRVVVNANGNIIGLVPVPNGGAVTRVANARVEDTAASGQPC